jgi:NTE family protein
VWKALAGRFMPDLVVGASIGSINGWLIAGGCSPAELEDLWLNSGDALHLRPRLPRHWSQGCLDLAPVHGMLSDLFQRFTPKTEYAAVAMDVFRLRPTLFTAEQMTWSHLLASCAVLGAFDLQRLDGRFYADGGILSALPLWAAAELGATRIIAVNPLPDAPRPLQWASSVGRAIARFRPDQLNGAEVLRITPRQPLGRFREMLQYRRDRIERWIAEGEQDAARMEPLL